MKTPSDPTGDRGATFLAALRERFGGLGLDELELARTCAALIDLIEELEGIVEREGIIVSGPRGTALHPAQVELRHAREGLRKTLHALNLPKEVEPDVETPED